MSKDIMTAHDQWALRPPDERFDSLGSMHKATRTWANQAETHETCLSNMKVEYRDNQILLHDRSSDIRFRPSHWAWNQILTETGAPRRYLSQLPKELATKCLNHSLEGVPEHPRHFLAHPQGETQFLRGVVSDRYTRIWNYQIIEKLIEMDSSWGPPVPGAPWDSNNDTKDHGLYASNHDMFAFMVNEDNRIDDGTEEGLGRGFFVANSEIGAGSLLVSMFLYRYVCGNHIVWGAEDFQEVRYRHIGEVTPKAWKLLSEDIHTYFESTAAKTEEKIRDAKKAILGKDREEVVNEVYKMNKMMIPKTTLGSAFDIVVEKFSDIDGDPRTAWGMAQGLTRISQQTAFGDTRMAIDRGASKVLTLTTA